MFNVSNEYLLDNTETMNNYSYERNNNKEDENKLGLSYWGSIADNARKLAHIGKHDDITDALYMLDRAVSYLRAVPV